MNKLFYVFLFAFASAPLFAAASTCESRVDKHLDKSTSEKVERCLTEEPEADDEGPVTEVILSDTYSVQYPKPKGKKAAQNAQTTKIYSTAPVSMEFLDRKDYPAFRNDVLPSMNAEQAHETALEALRGKQKPAKQSADKPARKTKAAAKPAASAPTQTPPAEIERAQALQNDPLYQNNTAGGTVPNGFLDGGVTGPDGFGYNATDPAFQP